MRVGIADLRLARSKAPPWLIPRMKKLANALLDAIIEIHGSEELLRRLSNPFFFQSLAAALAWEWETSGATTVVGAVIKDVLNSGNYGIRGAGGKGSRGRETPREIIEHSEDLGLGDRVLKDLLKASRLSAKVDNSLLQDGYDLYHHLIFFDERGNWVVIQQGMNPEAGMARRYHWISENLVDFFEEPHSGIVSDRKEGIVLNLVDRRSRRCRNRLVELVREERPERIERMIRGLRSESRTLDWYLGERAQARRIIFARFWPRRIDLRSLRLAWEIQPRDLEELLLRTNVGESTIRGLALVSHLIFGDEISWRDPAIYNLAFGSKSGIPYPPKLREMEEAARFIEEAIDEARLGRDEKIKILNRLRRLVEL